MTFHDTYTVKAGDNLSKIGRAFGYENPGPIYAYPPNQTVFRSRSPDLLRPGERLLVPWHPDILRKVVATSSHLIDLVTKDAARFIQELVRDKKELDEFLFKIDAVNFLANLGVGLGALAAKGPGAEMTAKEALVWLAESRATVGANIATLAIPAPQAPKQDFKFYVRHALGPWNPSYWASVVTAIKEKDMDLYLYGADATVYKNSLKIKQQAESDVARLRERMHQARQQLSMTYYSRRI